MTSWSWPPRLRGNRRRAEVETRANRQHPWHPCIVTRTWPANAPAEGRMTSFMRTANQEDRMPLIVQPFPAGPLATNAYLVADPETSVAILVDAPPGVATDLLAAVAAGGYRLAK